MDGRHCRRSSSVGRASQMGTAGSGEGGSTSYNDLVVVLLFLLVSMVFCSTAFSTNFHLLFTSSMTTCNFKLSGYAVVIMGVSGSGKSTVGKALAESMGCSFLEADDFHSEKNKEKMSKGIPLSDEDRIPWLQALRDAASTSMAAGENVVLTCSALQRKYREILRQADTNYSPGSHPECRVRFVCLEAPVELIAERMERRSREGNHFMPVTLLKSQLDLLQIDDDEGVIMVDATSSLHSIVGRIQACLKMKMNCNSETALDLKYVTNPSSPPVMKM